MYLMIVLIIVTIGIIKLIRYKYKKSYRKDTFTVPVDGKYHKFTVRLEITTIPEKKSILITGHGIEGLFYGLRYIVSGLLWFLGPKNLCLKIVAGIVEDITVIRLRSIRFDDLNTPQTMNNYSKNLREDLQEELAGTGIYIMGLDILGIVPAEEQHA